MFPVVEKNATAAYDFNSYLRKNVWKCSFCCQEKLELQHESLQRTLSELKAYKSRHESYLEKHKRRHALQLPTEEQKKLNLLMENFKKENGLLSK